MSSRIRNMVLIGVFAALAYTVMFFIRLPIPGFPPFLTYDPKDAVIGIAGFILGPFSAIAIAVLVSALELVTVSTTGLIGFVMNAISSIAFIGTAAFIYKRKPSIKSALVGILVGALTVTAVMLLWNYLIVPLYMGVPREAVAKMLIPTFLPFNLLKSSINGLLILLLYTPVMRALEVVGFSTKDRETADNE
jgi:riboflavin transporter FmnP